MPTDPSSARHRPDHLSAKYAHPRLPSTFVPLPRLLSALDDARDRRLTLVSAGAGAGKTMLLAAWAARHAGRTAWASLETADSDPARFWFVFIAALRTLFNDASPVGALALRMLDAEARPPMTTVVTALLNDLAAHPIDGEPLSLTLDDYHVIEDAAVHEGVAFLVDHLPDHVRLVVASRVDPDWPLARWRASGWLAEFRSADLSLSLDETAAFFARSLGTHDSLTHDLLSLLHQRTEGWVTGLQLAALALRQRDDAAAFVRGFHGGHRFLSDYFLAEVVQRQPMPVQRFLLQTSVLSRLRADACAALTGDSEAAAQATLESLERANLFVVPLDDERQSYRVHDLFRDALLARLQTAEPDTAREMHRRAARWFESRPGAAREATEHALAAADFDLAARLIALEAPRMWRRGEAQAVHRWIAALPDEWLREHATLAIDAVREWLELVHGAVRERYEVALREAEQTMARIAALAPRDDADADADADATRVERRSKLLHALIASRALFKGGDIDRMRQIADEAAVLADGEEARWKRVALGIRWRLIEARQRAGGLLIPELLEAKARMLAEDDPVTTGLVLRALAMAYLRQAQPRQAERESLQALALLDDDGADNADSAATGYFHYYLSSCCYQTNRLHEAAREVEHVLRIARTWQLAPLTMGGNLNAMLVHLARGDRAAAADALGAMEALVQDHRFEIYASLVQAARVQYWLGVGDRDAAARWAAGSGLAALPAQDWDPNRVAEVLLLVRVYLAQGRHDDALSTLRRFGRKLDGPDDGDTTLHYLALMLLALHAGGRRREARAVALRLLSMTEPEGQVRLFLDEGRPMRSALDELFSDRPATAPALPDAQTRFLAALSAEFAREERDRQTSPNGKDAEGEPLTPREREVHRLMMTGASNAEIAAGLAITLATVKKHVGNVLGKLGAQNRVQALARARGPV